jgi:hypothetical protein
VQADYEHQTSSAPGATSKDRFFLDSIRLYLGGSVTDKIKLTFDTEYTQDNNVHVLDAIGRFEYSPEVNVWVGRFLPPSDRANLYGAYYANDLFPYKDGVADFYPSVATGRDNGVAYWGQFDIVKVSVGVFDGPSAAGNNNKVISAARVMVDLWDPEPGYYLNGTYYGDKNILAIGIAGQHQSSDTSVGGTKGGTSWNVDGLMEKKFGDGGVVSVESEYQHDSGLINSSNGWYALAAYLFPMEVGPGKFQLLGKYSNKTTHAAFDVTNLTKEININYVLKTFNARAGFFYVNYSDPVAPYKLYGIKLQLQV